MQMELCVKMYAENGCEAGDNTHGQHCLVVEEEKKIEF